MRFNPETQPVGLLENIFESTAEQSLEADINLPDYCPEIRKILKCTVSTNILSIQNNSGRITVEANALVKILYVGENEKAASYEQKYPLQKIIESDKITADSSVGVRINTDYANCRAVNPRRLDIRAMLTFIFKGMKKTGENILCSASGDGVQTLTQNHCFASLTGVCEKPFSMSEVIEIQGDKPTVSQIINISSTPLISEVKIISNKALLKGELIIKIYYLSEENSAIENLEHSLPISRIIEIDGINENNLCGIGLTVNSSEGIPKADSAGDIRLIDFSAVISAFMAVFEEKDVDLITDVYSTEYELKTVTKNIEALSFNDTVNTSFTNKIVFESIGVSVGNVVAAWCSDIKYNFSSKDAACRINGTYQATVLYKDSENRLGIIQKPVDFGYSHKLKNESERIACYGSVVVSACFCAVTGDSRLELKSEISVSAIILSSCNKKYICSIEPENKKSKNDLSSALTVYFCDKGENVWNIAKKYNTTVEAVMAENELKSDLIENDCMLLIPSA